ncbi:MAG: sugar ABC transporter permease [Defluviitaleaceae bacterium]|nr:sugar ABC transporter permease [Defluviitaleaceae bacterium]
MKLRKASLGKPVSALPLKTKIFQRVEPYLYLLPALSMLILFTYYPFITNVIHSFFTVDRFRRVRAFAGLRNYSRVLTDDSFLQAVGNTFIYVLATVPISIVIGFALALLAKKKTRFSVVYETLFALSMAISIAVIAMIFQLAYNPSMGAINQLFGLSISWLSDPSTALLSLIIIQIWSNIGYNFLFMFSALRALPEDVMESSRMDGAVRSRLLFQIIIPLVSPTLLFLLMSGIAHAMTSASLVLILTTTHGATGQPGGATEVIMSFIYGRAIMGTNFNVAYAATTVGFVLSSIVMALALVLDRKKVSYDV